MSAKKPKALTPEQLAYEASLIERFQETQRQNVTLEAQASEGNRRLATQQFQLNNAQLNLVLALKRANAAEQRVKVLEKKLARRKAKKP